ncbi:MAG TPA: hypothetical protein VNS08_01920 [Ureibacillus sp.]|nr:hypothetical protein [Ureibacillus sp.]
MRVSGFQNNDNFEERKRALQRKEANNAYKKNTAYSKAIKNPVFEILQNLLSGKTEKELFENERTLVDEVKENITKDVNKEGISIEGLSSELIRQFSVEPQSDDIEKVNRFPKEQFDFSVPLNSSLNSQSFVKTYKKAVSSYTYQMQLAQNNFKMEESNFSHIA